MYGQPAAARHTQAAAVQQRPCYSAVSRGSLSRSSRGATRWAAAKAYGGNTCVSTKKVPCTAAPAGAPWTSYVAAVDEAARSPPGRIFPDIRCSDIRERPPALRVIPGWFSWTDRYHPCPGAPSLLPTCSSMHGHPLPVSIHEHLTHVKVCILVAGRVARSAEQG